MTHIKKGDDILNKKCEMFFIIVAILFIASLSGCIDLSEENNVNHDIYNVENEHDDARTFKVTLNEEMGRTEDGKWSSLQLSPSYSFGLRFKNITIPNNASIINSYIEIYSTGSPGLDHPNCNIYCDNDDNASDFTLKGALNITGRNYTQNYSVWNETVEYGAWVKSPSIDAQLQEVISRKNWTNGNSIVVLFITNGYRNYSATFKNFEQGYPAKLHIFWKN